jgi:hypothetical protein
MEDSPILRYFNTDHLPVELAAVARQFTDVAHLMQERLPTGAEKSTCLRKLLEAKDCAVRASLPDL